MLVELNYKNNLIFSNKNINKKNNKHFFVEYLVTHVCMQIILQRSYDIIRHSEFKIVFAR